MEKTVVELFAGVGGFRVGLNHIKSIDNNGLAIEDGNWEFVWANQWEPSTVGQDAFECYTKRFGDNNNHSNEDISLVNKKNIPDHNLLVGGFPCQDYSVARTKAGEKGLKGKKGVLFWQIMDVIKKKKPAFILLENVDRLLKSPAKQRGRDFGIMLRSLYDQGYDVEWRVINAADYNNYQRRRRVFIFAWKKNTNYGRKTGKPIDILNKDGLFAKAFPIESIKNELNYVSIHPKSFKDTAIMTNDFSELFENTGVMIDSNVFHTRTTPLNPKGKPIGDILIKKELEYLYLTEEQNKKMAYLKGAKSIERTSKDGHTYNYTEGKMSYPDNIKLPGRTMLTSEGSMNRSTHIVPDLVTGSLRKIDPIEAERLQGFPDNWTNTGMSISRRYFMMGNALVTTIIKDLEPFLADIFENE